MTWERGKWPRASLAERLYANYVVNENGCWVWQRGCNAEGYGIILPNGSDQRLRVHRVSYELHTGDPIPAGLTLDHTCHTNDPTCVGGKACLHRRCINPFHLEPVTRGENVRRGAARIVRTHCANGHPWIPENIRTRVRGKGYETHECILCHREQTRARYALKRAQVAA